MTENGSPTVLTFVQELVKEEVNCSAKGVERKVPNVFCKIESGECQRER